MQQLKLKILEIEDPTTPDWDDLDPNARKAFVRVLARTIAQAIDIQPMTPSQEDNHDR